MLALIPVPQLSISSDIEFPCFGSLLNDLNFVMTCIMNQPQLFWELDLKGIFCDMWVVAPCGINLTRLE